MRRIFHITAAYTSADYELTPEDLCVVKVRGEETKYLSIDEVLNNFANIPHVKGCNGISHAYIFNTETRESQYLIEPKKQPTQDDVLVANVLGYMCSRQYAKIASDMYSNNKDIEISIREWVNEIKNK